MSFSNVSVVVDHAYARSDRRYRDVQCYALLGEFPSELADDSGSNT